jgi:hypothetical protein
MKKIKRLSLVRTYMDVQINIKTPVTYRGKGGS